MNIRYKIVLLILWGSFPTLGYATEDGNPISPKKHSNKTIMNKLMQYEHFLPNFLNNAPVTSAPIAQFFPKISEKQLIDLFNEFKKLRIQKMIQPDPKTHLPAYVSVKLPHLKACACALAPFPLRILTILNQAHDLLITRPNKNELLVHTVFGEREFLHTYLFAMTLSKLGFTNIHLNLVVPNEIHISNLNPYFKPLQSIKGITDIKFFKWGSDYIEAVSKGKAERSDSFDMIDVGYDNFIQLSPKSRRANYFIINKSSSRPNNLSSTQFDLFRIALYERTSKFYCLSQPNNMEEAGLMQTHKSQSDFGRKFCKQLRTRISVTRSHREAVQILYHFSSEAQSTIFKNWNADSPRIFAYQNAGISFEELIDHTWKLGTSPLIYELNGNIVKYHSRYQSPYSHHYVRKKADAALP